MSEQNDSAPDLLVLTLVSDGEAHEIARLDLDGTDGQPVTIVYDQAKQQVTLGWSE